MIRKTRSEKANLMRCRSSRSDRRLPCSTLASLREIILIVLVVVLILVILLVKLILRIKLLVLLFLSKGFS